jgi:crotonobetainyl-CoA:carnitine CoA-transferase CaiB-like acyl-CoA transferase
MTGRASAGPLMGVRVLDIGGDIATRYCGRLMARLGASVSRVANPPSHADSATCAAERTFNAWLDEGKFATADLASALSDPAAIDVVIAGQTPAEVQAVDATLAAWGGTHIRLGLTWFGEEGPYAAWRGNDAIIQALSGVAFGFGTPEGPPVLPQGHAPQLIAGLNGFIGVLAALMSGQDGTLRVDVNVFEAALCFSEAAAVGADADPAVQSQRGGVNRFSAAYPCSVFRTTDGHVGVTAVTPAQWGALCHLIDRPELARDPRLATSADRAAHADEIDRWLAPALAERTTAEWVAEADRLHIPVAPANRPRDLAGMAHWSRRGAFDPVDDGTAAPTLPFRFSFDDVRGSRPNGGARGPLTGLRVVDFSMGWAGPLATRYLADLGADVLKIESSTRPDWWRGWEVVQAQDPPLHELLRHFLSVNRNKRGLDIDLATPAGLAAARALIGGADVVIENQGPGVMDRLGLGQGDQRLLRPGIVSICMPPFGLGGPLSGLRAYGSTVEHASGMPFINGHADWPPSIQHLAYGDPVAGIYAAAAALAALYGRSTLGGAQIEVCQVECLFQLCADGIILDQQGGVVRNGSRRPGAAPVCAIKGAGHEDWLAIAVDGDAAWRGLCAIVDDDRLMPDWSLSERRRQEPAIEAALTDWAARRTAEASTGLLQNAGVAAAPVLPAHGLTRNDQLLAAGFWSRIDRRYVGEHVVSRTPIRFNGERPDITRPAPTLGEHTAEAMSELAMGGDHGF